MGQLKVPLASVLIAARLCIFVQVLILKFKMVCFFLFRSLIRVCSRIIFAASRHRGEGRWCGAGAVCFCLLQAAMFSSLKVMVAVKTKKLYGKMTPIKVSCPFLRSHHYPFVLL